MIVADTNLLVGLYLPSADTGLAESVLQRARCSANDCGFVSLAEELDAVLVTSDRQVLKAFRERAVTPAVFAGRG